MAPSARLFPAEDVFKHFTHTTEDGRERKVKIIRAITNPRVRVAGRLKKDGTFVIRLVESIPGPTIAPKTALKDCPVRMIAYLKDGMYVLYSLLWRAPMGEESRKVEFAGKPPEVWCQLAPNERAVWRVEFGRSRGRPSGTRNYTPEELIIAMEKAVRMWIEQHPYRRVPKSVMAKALGTTYRQLHACLTDDGVDFDEFCSSLRNQKNNSTI
jgi:hypothetical protein